MPLIEIRDLRHVYNAGTPQAVIALDGISLTVEPGEFLAVVGGNGSGKSTLAKHLNALLLPTSGEVWIDGLDTRDRAAVWDIRQRVGMVFQNPDNQLVATVVEEDVAFGPENLGIPPAEIALRVEAALGAVDMLEYRRHAPHLLSGGQKQRVAIAGVLAMRPRCLVLDEVTTMLDPEGRREVLETVRRLNASGVTVVNITHSMEEAALAQRIVALQDGRIGLHGPPGQVFARAEELEALGLTLPLIPALVRALRADGLALGGGILSAGELVEALAHISAAAAPGGGA